MAPCSGICFPGPGCPGFETDPRATVDCQFTYRMPLAIPGLIAQPTIANVGLWRDCGMMLALTLLLALFAYAINSRPTQPYITRFEGAVMLFAWVGYNILLLQQVT